jgi:membrane-anchored mycosin MYCP
MRPTSLRRAAAAAAVGVLLTVAPFGTLPALADTVAQLPELPHAKKGCVADSGKVLTEPPWAQRRLAPTQVWPLTRGEGVLIAVLDTGVSAAAPALADAVRPGTDVVAGGAADSDCLGRGTALAGIVAARPISSSAFVGVAPAATILPIRIVDAHGEIPPDGIARGITAALAAGADVILVGTGTTVTSPGLASAVRAAEAHDVVVVASAANDAAGGADGAVWYPAALPDVIAVGGIDEEGRPVGHPADGSGVDIAGPGGSAASIGPRGTGHYRVGGTPVAAAYVAGAVGLVRSYSPGLTAREVRDRLVQTAETPTSGALQRWLGAGTVDILAAVAATRVGDKSTSPIPMGDVVLPQAPDRPRSYGVGILASIAVLLGTAALVLAGLTVRTGRRRRWTE